MTYIRHPHFHITSRTKDREPFKIPLSNLWSSLQLILKELELNHHFELTSMVLMQNHYHMLVRMPQEKLIAFIQAFNHKLSLHSHAKLDETFLIDPILQRTYFFQTYRYIYQNPVRAGIVARCEYYPYSTLFHLARGSSFSVFIYDMFCVKDRFGLNLINTPVHKKVPATFSDAS
jgi:putative transposase